MKFKLNCLDLVAAFKLSVSSAVCTRQPPTASMLARFRLLAWSCVHVWLLRPRAGSDFAQERLPAPDPVLYVSDPVLWPMPACVWRDVQSVFLFLVDLLDLAMIWLCFYCCFFFVGVS